MSPQKKQRRFAFWSAVQNLGFAETFHVVVNLLELIVIGRIRNRREMKDRVECSSPNCSASRCRQILRNKVYTVTGQILEITGDEIVNHRNTRFRESFLQSQCGGIFQPNKTSADRDNEVKRACN